MPRKPPIPTEFEDLLGRAGKRVLPFPTLVWIEIVASPFPLHGTTATLIAAQDVELCDCFLEFGEASAEMFLLLTFVAFGAALLWTGLEVANVRTVAFAVIALIMRTAVLYPVLARAGLDRRSRRLIAWLGPRGLSSLLLVLLPVFGGVPGATGLFTITCLVVLLSVIVHGTGIAIWLRRDAA